MAAEPNNDLSLPKQDAGLAFRAEMALSNVVLGYWPYAAGLVVVGLLATLVYGIVSNDWKQKQRGWASEIATVSEPLEGITTGESADDKAIIRGVADDLAGVGRHAKGAARAEAWLRAAELYRMVGDTEQQRAAFIEASATAKGALLYAAKSGAANLDLADGKGDDAIAALKDLLARSDGLLAEQAALDLAIAYEALERPSEARAVYTDFLARWPESPRVEVVEERMARLGGGA